MKGIQLKFWRSFYWKVEFENLRIFTFFFLNLKRAYSNPG